MWKYLTPPPGIREESVSNYISYVLFLPIYFFLFVSFCFFLFISFKSQLTNMQNLNMWIYRYFILFFFMYLKHSSFKTKQIFKNIDQEKRKQIFPLKNPAHLRVSWTQPQSHTRGWPTKVDPPRTSVLTWHSSRRVWTRDDARKSLQGGDFQTRTPISNN